MGWPTVSNPKGSRLADLILNEGDAIPVTTNSDAVGADPAFTAFGENTSAENFPYIQATGTYNFLPSNFRAFTDGTGSTSVADRLFTVETGAGVGGYGAIQSFRSINYKAGEGGLARFTAIFESNAANSWQGVGMISIGDELSFGYNGTEFGVWHRYGGLAEVRTLTVTVAAGGAETLTLTLNGTAYSIPLTSGTTKHNAYEIADWLNDTANQSVWKADHVDSTVIISAQSDGAKSGSYSVSSTGSADGTIAQDTAGVTKTSDHVPTSQWNGSNITDLVSNLDPSKGNVYQISYQYLGFGDIKFYLEDPETGSFVLVHTIRYANANTTPSLTNPSLRVGLYAVSLGSTTNLAVKSGSLAGFTQGRREKTRNPRAFSNTQSIGTTLTTILAIRNRRTYNGRTNQVEIEPSLLSIANEGSKNISIEVRSTTDPGVELDYTAVGSNLVSDASTTSTTGISTGRLLLSTVVAPSSSVNINLAELRIRVPPTLNLIIQGSRASGSASDCSAALVWYEDV